MLPVYVLCLNKMNNIIKKANKYQQQQQQQQKNTINNLTEHCHVFSSRIETILHN